MNTEEIRNVVLTGCREFGVRRLDAFGSVARGEGTTSSDIDLLVEFDDPDRNPAKRFFGFLHFLEDTLGGNVDLLTLEGLRNPYIKKRVLKERVPIYEG
jgi:predicted nucleotidyltransferase